MAKYHISKNGKTSVCQAKEGNCPLGNESKHFNTEAEALKYFNENAKSQYGLLPSTEETLVFNPPRTSTIRPEHKVSPAKFKKEIEDYPVGTYVKYATKGSINDSSQYVYGKMKVGPDSWTAYSSIIGYPDEKKIISTETFKDAVLDSGTKNIGVVKP